MSHRVPPARVEVVTAADVVADAVRMRDAIDRMGRRPVVSRERTPAPASEALPPIPELVPGADAAARRETIDRGAVLIRELAALLGTAPPDVAARARRALLALTVER